MDTKGFFISLFLGTLVVAGLYLRLQASFAEDRQQGLSSEELLSRLPLVEIEAYLKKHKAAQDNISPDQPKPQSL